MTGSGLEAAFLANRASLLRFLRARGAGEGAEDLLQEVWIRAAADARAPIADPLAYLYRAANNLMIDRVRASSRGAARDRRWADARELAGHAVEAPSGERALIAREELAAAEAVLAGLGARTDEVFRRFRVEGVSQRRIADDLGISLSAVEKHLQRAYRALADLRRRFDAE